MANITIVSCSSNSHAKSRLLAVSCQQELALLGHNSVLVDFHALGEFPTWTDDTFEKVKNIIRDSSYIVFSTPVYVYDVAHPVKALIENLQKKELENKIVGFLCAAGSKRSFMAPMNFSNALMLNYRCWIVPRFVYACSEDFVDGVATDEINRRITLFSKELVKFERKFEEAC